MLALLSKGEIEPRLALWPMEGKAPKCWHAAGEGGLSALSNSPHSLDRAQGSRPELYVTLVTHAFVLGTYFLCNKPLQYSVA